MSAPNADSGEPSRAPSEAKRPRPASRPETAPDDAPDDTLDETVDGVPSPEDPSEPSSFASRRFYIVMGVAVAIGFAIGVMGYGNTVAGLMAQIGLPLLIIVTGWRRAASRLSSESPSLADGLTKTWSKYGGGFYSLVTAFVFLSLEVRTLMDEVGDAWTTWQSSPAIAEYNAFVGFLADQLWTVAISTFIRFSIETVINGIKAGLWPIYGIKQFGFWPLAIAVAVGYALFAAAQRYVPAFQVPGAALQDASASSASAAPNTASSSGATSPPDAPMS